MAIKKVTVKSKEANNKVTEMSHFGYKAVEIKENGDKTSIIFSRNLGKGDKVLKELEKEYHKVTKPAPTFGIVLMVLGVMSLVAYFVFSKDIYISLIGLLLAIIFFGLGLFYIATFFISMAFRQRIIEDLFIKGDRHQGIIRDYPVTKNLEAINQLTGMLKANIDNIVPQPSKK